MATLKKALSRKEKHTYIYEGGVYVIRELLTSSHGENNSVEVVCKWRKALNSTSAQQTMFTREQLPKTFV